jgi:hypothetical protein
MGCDQIIAKKWNALKSKLQARRWMPGYGNSTETMGSSPRGGATAVVMWSGSGDRVGTPLAPQTGSRMSVWSQARAAPWTENNDEEVRRGSTPGGLLARIGQR